MTTPTSTPTTTPPNSLSKKLLHHLTRPTTLTKPQLHQILAKIILHNLHPNPTITISFIKASAHLNLLHFSLLLFHHHFHRPHVLISNHLIRALSHSPSPLPSLSVFSKVHSFSFPTNNYTYPFILKSLSDLRLLKQGQSVHTHLIKTGHFGDLYVQNSILNLYSSCGEMGDCEKVFDEIPVRDAVSWTVMVSGNRCLGRFGEALAYFTRMQFHGVSPNHVTMVNALAACAGAGELDMGVWIHEYVRKQGWELDVILGTSLVDMYGKCGRINIGVDVFLSMVERNVCTWNSLIGGLALARSGEEAVRWFFRMDDEGIKPDSVSGVCVLCACSHSGLVDMGRWIFQMVVSGKYGFSPGIKHYGCMIDLLGRAGLLEEAVEFVERMPFEANVVIWVSLLSACRAHGDLDLSVLTARKLVELEPERGAYYALLSNLYAEMGRWSDVMEVRRAMRERSLKKDLDSSITEMEPTRMIGHG
ncbi:Pentatricopeptide repeat-containing protein [Acorus gramineus]|uniref:Pentatricopeptide repeat-containing protein n=1 Tax=Acorus gramineus TaxID=55184 RepID=A0AAV9BMQ4_ACOGR|nr:Pentatricopeptide repeat-containing protein [Acorus gramineus]